MWPCTCLLCRLQDNVAKVVQLLKFCLHGSMKISITLVMTPDVQLANATSFKHSLVLLWFIHAFLMRCLLTNNFLVCATSRLQSSYATPSGEKLQNFEVRY